LKQETQLEALPSFGETIVLYIIMTNQPVTGYQIRKLFIETTKRGLSFGTLVPMLQRFEKAQLAVRERNEEGASSYNWHLTPLGMGELEWRLSLLSKLLRDRESNIKRIANN